MKKRLILPLAIATVATSTVKVSAHCPLCTGGAGAAAAAAAYFGVTYGSLGVLLGGFTTALALWFAHKPPKKYFKQQSAVVFWLIYLSTAIPFYFMFRGDYVSSYVSLGGDYGSWSNRTYLLDLFLVGLILGSLIVYYSPRISAWVSRWRGGRQVIFQGLILNFTFLIVAATIVQVWPR